LVSHESKTARCAALFRSTQRPTTRTGLRGHSEPSCRETGPRESSSGEAERRRVGGNLNGIATGSKAPNLAGYAEQSDDEGEHLLIDSYDGPVADAVCKLYEIVISRRGPIPTLIEWDSKIPAWPILRAEAAAAQAILDRFTWARAAGGGHAA
jgi:hypothetical protein